MFNRNELKRLVEKEIKGDFFVPRHINSCFKNLDLIKESFFDEETVFAGIFLHSVGFPMSVKFNQDLISTSLNLGKKILVKSHFPMEKTEQVFYCIKESHLKGNPKTTESILVHDLNLLDEIGSIGIIKDIILFNSRKILFQKFLEEEKTKSFLLKKAFFSEKAKLLAGEKLILFDSFVSALEKELK